MDRERGLFLPPAMPGGSLSRQKNDGRELFVPSRRSDSLGITCQSLSLLTLIGAEQEGHDLSAGAAVAGAEGGSGGTVGHAVLHGPGRTTPAASTRSTIRAPVR